MEFNVKETTDKIIEDIQEYYRNNQAKGAVIGLSGGKDSAVVASLLVKAIGKDNVIGFWLPCDSKTNDKIDAEIVANTLGIKLITYDLTNTYKDIVDSIKQSENLENDDLLNNSNINLKPRLRTNILYYYAAYFTNLYKGLYLVCGTSNKSEVYVGYYTKGGDNVCDIAPIREFYVDEVIKIGDYLGMVPKRIIHKTPDDGISGLSDEEKLGFSYGDVKRVSMEESTGIMDNDLNDEIRKKVLMMHKNNLHKLNVPIFRR